MNLDVIKEVLVFSGSVLTLLIVALLMASGKIGLDTAFITALAGFIIRREYEYKLKDEKGVK